MSFSNKRGDLFKVASEKVVRWGSVLVRFVGVVFVLMLSVVVVGGFFLEVDVLDELDVSAYHAAMNAVFVVSLRGICHVFEDPAGGVLIVVSLSEVDGVVRVFNGAGADFEDVFVLGV